MFCLGLILVAVAGAELFTGNNLISMAWAERRVSLGRLARNWTLVYAGNLVGALATVALMFASKQYQFGDGSVGSALAILFPISAFVALGFEHSVANMYFLPIAVLIHDYAPDSYWHSIGKHAGDFPDISWVDSIGNLIPVTIGNVIGGAVMVGLVYWLVYMRRSGR